MFAWAAVFASFAVVAAVLGYSGPAHTRNARFLTAGLLIFTCYFAAMAYLGVAAPAF